MLLITQTPAGVKVQNIAEDHLPLGPRHRQSPFFYLHRGRVAAVALPDGYPIDDILETLNAGVSQGVEINGVMCSDPLRSLSLRGFSKMELLRVHRNLQSHQSGELIINNVRIRWAVVI